MNLSLMPKTAILNTDRDKNRLRREGKAGGRGGGEGGH